tara:strand:- start:77 stop:298 length:222 start_codon:yes stop_codon:yes gene_type:complete
MISAIEYFDENIDFCNKTLDKLEIKNEEYFEEFEEYSCEILDEIDEFNRNLNFLHDQKYDFENNYIENNNYLE